MRIYLIAVGSRLDGWVYQGYEEFAKRLPPDCALHLIEIPALKRGKNADIERITREEGRKVLAAIPKGAKVIALDVQGPQHSTQALARKLDAWLQGGQDVALLVGGPEGLADDCLACAQEKWSLSKLTLPHPLVRIVVAEQIYRAWSILNHHPYHR
ncbi:MAG: 23S rRNA (pseudouridine(1915)-N(3))-methyltransferase RlmH [Gammaproteobacteria bacterium]|jgi:23S rRNA (pseudouridine1915-N3)-methyltransferase|nr:23S rRNA (pseudouridine(1915)-N(3))-methyltransferase RlmH [Gammaproteobacteria bacterium]